MIVKNVKCNECGNTLPTHTEAQHLDKNDPVHQCPHRDTGYDRWLREEADVRKRWGDDYKRWFAAWKEETDGNVGA